MKRLRHAILKIIRGRHTKTFGVLYHYEPANRVCRGFSPDTHIGEGSELPQKRTLGVV
jgi:hypothetical protein